MKKYLENIYVQSASDYHKELSTCLKQNKKRFIITVNPETIMTAKDDLQVSKMLLDKKNSFVPDGIAIVKACRMLDIPVAERITGVDIAEFLLQEAHNQKKSLYLFGSKPEVISAMVDIIKTKYSNIKLVGYSDGYVKDRNKIFKDIIKAKPDICLVALGIPDQEKIIYEHLDKFDKGIFVGVGGSLDVLSGSKKRAPKLFIKLNLEWFYRIITEPKRIKRFWNNNIKFIFQIRKERK